MSAEELHENNNAPNRLKQIQDLMFREYIDDWENKVKVLYRKIKELEAQTSESSKNLDERFQTMKAELMEELTKEKTARATAFETFKADVTKKVNTLLSNSKVEKESLGKLLIQLGEKVSNHQ